MSFAIRCLGIVVFLLLSNLATAQKEIKMVKNNSKHIVFIHGLFQNPKSWNDWKIYFEAMGYTCHTPAYPFHNGEPENLRKYPNTNLGKLTFGDVIDSLTQFINDLPEQPILVGHSMGGLAVQKLINSGIGSLGVCIDSAPPKGISCFKGSFLKANFPIVNPFKGNSFCLPSVKWFHYAFCNTMSLDEAEKIYNELVVPESRNIPRSSTKKDGKIDFNKPHAPLLFVAGLSDNIIPHSLNLKNAEAYKDTSSRVDYKAFEGRTHFICGQENWQEVADHIEEWIKLN